MSSPQAPTTEMLFGLFTQAALYGVYVATLIHCLRWLVYTDEGWKQRGRVNRLMLITTILIFLCSTTNLFLALSSQSYIMGDPWDSNIVGLLVTQVCKYHGWHLGQNMTCVLLFPESDRDGPDSDCRCSSGLSRFVRLKVLVAKTYHAFN